MIRRNLYFAPTAVKAKAYLATCRPSLEYAASVWSPSSDSLKHDIEMVQHRAAKFVTNQYPKKGHYSEFSVTKIVDDLGWDTLEQRRNQARCSMVYKIIHGKVILPPSTLPLKQYARPTRTCTEPLVGFHNELVVPRSNCRAFQDSFYCATPAFWNNNITSVQAASPSIDAFKAQF